MKPRTKARWPWLLAAALLLVLAAFLMTPDKEPVWGTPPPPSVEFPDYMRQAEWERAKERRTLPVATTVNPDEDARTPPPAMRDPVLRALPPPGPDSTFTVVVEANALRHSALGEMFLECLGSNDRQELTGLQDKYGVDIFEDIDRVAAFDGGMMISGHFGEAHWEDIFKGFDPSTYGDEGVLYVEADTEKTMGVWRNEMVIMGDSGDEVRSAIDRVEGRVQEPPAFDENFTYGEVYGTISGARVTDLLGGGQSELAEQMRDLVDRVELHADAMEDVAISGSFLGGDPEGLQDLAKTIGTAISLGRVSAMIREEEELSLLLENARVSPYNGSFQLQLALPRELLEEHLKKNCAAQREVEEHSEEAPQ